MVGVYEGNATDKNNCLIMIREEKSRQRRENDHEEQEQESREDSNGQAGQDLEEVRATMRIQYLEKIDKVNREIREKEQSLGGKLQINKIKMKELNEKQDLEKKTLDKQLKEDKINLEQRKAKHEQQLANLSQQLTKTQRNLAEIQQRMAMMQQRDIRENKGIAKKHADEKNKFEEKIKIEDKEGQRQLAKLKEVTQQLARDLKKLDMDPDNNASSNDHEKVEATRETLECPVCMEPMKPPTRIWMCSSSHIICESCKDKIEGTLCPTCKTETVTMRAIIVEQIARTIFNQ